MKVSIIVPIYGVEKYIERCVRSLLEQTYENIEYIFVNDETLDNSIQKLNEVIKLYPHRCKHIKILSHKENKGLPAARNTGLSVATGDYIFHCDSDDWIEKDMIQSLCNKVTQESADIVWCDWYLSFEKNERYMTQPRYTTPIDALKGILSGVMKYNVWNKLVKRSLYEENHIQFPTGHGMGEDMTMIKLFACANKVAYLSKAYYHYVKLNGEAYTNTFSLRHLEDIRYNVDNTILFLKERYNNELNDYISFFKLSVKYPFIISDKRKIHELWNEWYPESNKYIALNPNFSWRSKFLQYAAKNKQYWILWLHYILVYRFIYGVLYR